MATITVNNADDRAYIREHIEVADNLKAKALELRLLQAKVTDKQTILTEIGDRILAGLTRQNAAAAAALGGSPTDIEVQDDGGANMTLHTDADAEAYRNA